MGDIFFYGDMKPHVFLVKKKSVLRMMFYVVRHLPPFPKRQLFQMIHEFIIMIVVCSYE